jgi:hypothetical protein
MSNSFEDSESLLLHLGNALFKSQFFSGLDKVFACFHEPDFKNLKAKRRFQLINNKLLELIQETPAPSFLLPAVIDFIDRVNTEDILKEKYRFKNFEFWLNHFSLLSPEDNYRVRGKIVGKLIPRSCYQNIFPIGMNTKFSGSHFVSAHLSPDVDTTVASFVGWLDAFGAFVSEGLHLWSLPGGPPDSHIQTTFTDFLGSNAFSHIIHSSGKLKLCSIDLLTQKGLQKIKGTVSTTSITHSMGNEAVVHVDENGYYIGDWRSSDIEGARRVIAHFSSFLRWFENNLHSRLITFFSKKDPRSTDIRSLSDSLYNCRIAECEPAHDFTELQNTRLCSYLKNVLQIEKGLDGTFSELANSFKDLGIAKFFLFRLELESLEKSDLFTADGKLNEDRPKIFHALEKLILSLDEAIQSIRVYVDRLDMMMAIKKKVFLQAPAYVTLKSGVEEIRDKMGHYDSLTVVIPDKDGKVIPVGMIKASDLRNEILGTVTLRDFCNRDEIYIAPYLSIISVIDHHKTSLNTSSAPIALIADAQSCNVLIAEQSFLINDQYSSSAEKNFSINENISVQEARLLQKSLQKKINSDKDSEYFIHPQREYLEYLLFIYAILDDTDLLMKVSKRDVDCVAQLLNRMKSLCLGKEVEVIHFDDLPHNEDFPKLAASRILQNDDMYSLYKNIYAFKEEEHDRHLDLCARGKASNLFNDTKEQNACTRIGQTKLFASNFEAYKHNRHAIRSHWLENAQAAHENENTLDLHVHMISTISGADEVYQGKYETYYHRDEIWIWIAPSETSHYHLEVFLEGFGQSEAAKAANIKVSLLGHNARDLNEVFSKHFSEYEREVDSQNGTGLPIAILRCKPGSINSRKSMITPYLPQLVS